MKKMKQDVYDSGGAETLEAPPSPGRSGWKQRSPDTPLKSTSLAFSRGFFIPSRNSLSTPPH